MSSINYIQLEKEINAQIAEKLSVRRSVQRETTTLVNEEKKELVKEFESHIVSQEISEGENASNISNTLGGYGNLFSFIGFNIGSKPIPEISAQLKEDISVKLPDSPKIQRGIITYSVPVEIPTVEDIEKNLPEHQDWNAHWVSDIEDGFSNLTHYLYKKFRPEDESRSTMGLQVKNENKDGNVIYKRPSNGYLGEMLKRFKDKIKNL